MLSLNEIRQCRGRILPRQWIAPAAEPHYLYVLSIVPSCTPLNGQLCRPGPTDAAQPQTPALHAEVTFRLKRPMFVRTLRAFSVKLAVLCAL